MTLSEDHIKRINKALHYIESHLESDLSLAHISSIAHYSPYHFHRVFKQFTKETLNNYVARKRVEKASAILLRQKNVSISELSTQFGFTSHSSFTRAFRKFYGMSPSEFRRQSKGKYSKIRQTKSKNGQTITDFEPYVWTSNQNTTTLMSSQIEVKHIDTIHTVGITCIGKQHLSPTIHRLIEWAGSQGLLRDSKFKIATVFYDSFKITAPDKVRMSACLVVNQPTTTDGEVTSITLSSGSSIKGHFEIEPHEFPMVWTNLFKWMNANGYQKRDEPPFEIYHNDFNTHPEKKCLVDLYIPVK
ncbi:GyrI-like domain-containing protein [Psychroserpens sp. SPM9]|uniref:AraC family transcriptional regulator n=1 Tax=Psychroserpens sp. SPM9 TaxID=2975598 RepID=UPI0021A599B9|nr:AraC family transcriptional regulator [Psychroserpens sp. SPM9]MDG5492324.1 AraC family transcriptional regulator [Psychroserpens sp. SPM9]